uniref:FAD-binding FR-type domain-containing protein n=1 Tax=Lotharella globosa TaxID=91324 RepID=A0A7S4DYC0_9EUKA|mmetsp:Transcript_18109/g.34471  ORF Transcript_18109/g.34471 Transcript_18109/m.34471 type:complete len:631 (+) Transcript_18109:139-2031(+)|eukprot:CAMPEP_0167784276 /NCGR_PEP_ID=MMETSP0111_2-20121227/7546_1 /TAXON_ID=91324 /ORGANISM="Lotharella globosa, Strain CCCM811" /LENGTH=630 /DNA_ID=CAMNT_0007675327 /DNA_START=68 /DNA_END=1960 /DNA_ORIENTATION=+
MTKSTPILGEFKPSAMGVFHETNYKMQERYYGKREDAKAHYFRDWIPKQHEDFYNKLPFTVLATADDADDLWVSVVTGEPGKKFMSATPTDVTFVGLDKMAANDDPLFKSMKPKRPMGMLGIELHTRRRNRLNGVIELNSSGEYKIGGPILSFGNCPQYITERKWKFKPQSARAPAKITSLSTSLSKQQQALISAATTMFIGTGHPATGIDASHRGGPIGFVRVVDAHTIMWPDFPGNHMLKSLGNIEANGKLGVWFGDFVSGSVIQMTGKGRIVWGNSEEGRKEAKALRDAAISTETARFPDNFNWVVFRAEKIVERSDALAVQWDLRDDYVDLEVTRIEQETKDIKSFYLSRSSTKPNSNRKREGQDQKGLTAPIPGQYLPIFVNPSTHAYVRGDNSKPLDRTYTISGYSDKHYRLTIKRVRRGKVSNFFHDEVKEGTVIQSRDPQGHFVLQNVVSEHNTRQAETPDQVVFISAGIGITPVLSILRDLVTKVEADPKTFPTPPSIMWVYGTQGPEALPRTLHKEVSTLVSRYRKVGGKAIQLTQFSQYTPEKLREATFSPSEAEDVRTGRMTAQGLKQWLKDKGIASKTSHFYVCGPTGFMGMLSTALEGCENVFTETFGPSAAAPRT